MALKSLVGSKEHASSRQARYVLDLQEHDLEIIHRAGARHHIADIVSRTPATMVAATAVTPAKCKGSMLNTRQKVSKFIHQAETKHHIKDTVSHMPTTMVAATSVTSDPDEMKHYYSMVHYVSTPGIVPTNPEAFEKMLYQKTNLVGSKGCKYQDSQMFGEAIGQQSLANALDHASIPAESVTGLDPDTNTARSLLTQLHGDSFRQQRAWQNRKPIDQDPSRTLEIWETICELDEMQEQYTVDTDSDYESDT